MNVAIANEALIQAVSPDKALASEVTIAEPPMGLIPFESPEITYTNRGTFDIPPQLLDERRVENPNMLRVVTAITAAVKERREGTLVLEIPQGSTVIAQKRPSWLPWRVYSGPRPVSVGNPGHGEVLELTGCAKIGEARRQQRIQESRLAGRLWGNRKQGFVNCYGIDKVLSEGGKLMIRES